MLAAWSVVHTKKYELLNTNISSVEDNCVKMVCCQRRLHCMLCSAGYMSHAVYRMLCIVCCASYAVHINAFHCMQIIACCFMHVDFCMPSNACCACMLCVVHAVHGMQVHCMPCRTACHMHCSWPMQRARAMLTKSASATQQKVTLEHGNTALTRHGASTQCLQGLTAAMHMRMSCKSAQTVGNIHGELQNAVNDKVVIEQDVVRCACLKI